MQSINLFTQPLLQEMPNCRVCVFKTLKRSLFNCLFCRNCNINDEEVSQFVQGRIAHCHVHVVATIFRVANLNFFLLVGEQKVQFDLFFGGSENLCKASLMHATQNNFD